jgi:CRISPR/Cas system-associated exonuclease Cas4 (RecB family)
LRVELRFLESGLIGQAAVTEADLERARAFLRQAGQGIQAREFPAAPDEHNCRWCAFQAICPFAFKGILAPG